MRARFELPIQDVIKVVHGGRGEPPDPDGESRRISSVNQERRVPPAAVRRVAASASLADALRCGPAPLRPGFLLRIARAPEARRCSRLGAGATLWAGRP